MLVFIVVGLSDVFEQLAMWFIIEVAGTTDEVLATAAEALGFVVEGLCSSTANQVFSKRKNIENTTYPQWWSCWATFALLTMLLAVFWALSQLSLQG